MLGIAFLVTAGLAVLMVWFSPTWTPEIVKYHTNAMKGFLPCKAQLFFQYNMLQMRLSYDEPSLTNQKIMLDIPREVLNLAKGRPFCAKAGDGSTDTKGTPLADFLADWLGADLAWTPFARKVLESILAASSHLRRQNTTELDGKQLPIATNISTLSSSAATTNTNSSVGRFNLMDNACMQMLSDYLTRVPMGLSSALAMGASVDVQVQKKPSAPGATLPLHEFTATITVHTDGIIDAEAVGKLGIFSFPIQVDFQCLGPFNVCNLLIACKEAMRDKVKQQFIDAGLKEPAEWDEYSRHSILGCLQVISCALAEKAHAEERKKGSGAAISVSLTIPSNKNAIGKSLASILADHSINTIPNDIIERYAK